MFGVRPLNTFDYEEMVGVKCYSGVLQVMEGEGHTVRLTDQARF